MAPKKACLITFGCQMNEYDSGRLADLLTAAGWTMTDSRDTADFIFFNTCSIREKAAQRLLNHVEQVRSLKKKKPGLIIGVGGCVAEQEGEKLLTDAPWLDLVVGPQHLPTIPDLLEKLTAKTETGRAATGSGRRPAWSRENLAELGRDDGSRTEAGGLIGFVTIMQGCNNYCTYCVVPYLRGPELSRGAGDIIDEVKRLIDNGVKDLTLLGQNVNSYGLGQSGEPTFPELLEKVAATGIERLRFTTSHPKDFPPELVRLFGSLGPLCEGLHLPVQSGSDKVLKDMRRVYTRDSYLRLVDDLRTQCPGLSLTTDIIVGFPGETEKDFEDTVSLLDTVGYDAMFSFKYSDRPQTRSAAFENKVPEEEKGRRLTYLQTRQKDITLAKNAAHVGQVLEVLVERESDRYENQLTGRARNFKLIHFDGSPELIGRTVPVRVEEAWGASLRGVRAEK
ncbi:tRNA (N6-isopentenyl adenosine(37)-C2)-methylthiotransferase MiaB [Deltaproteobacteria bacterium Smac51]|nr:tRNA (N6-isopentenyl adenosine(37)-C2)-methylthiotransferase MiaB [Deltaproteobacteria bacterium Smac51]